MVIRQLIWDSWNRGHIAKHGIVPAEAEEVCHGNPLVQEGNKGRVVVIGPTSTGKMLEVVLHLKGKDVYYPVTAHIASKKDRRLYKIEKGGI